MKQTVFFMTQVSWFDHGIRGTVSNESAGNQNHSTLIPPKLNLDCTLLIYLQMPVLINKRSKMPRKIYVYIESHWLDPSRLRFCVMERTSSNVWEYNLKNKEQFDKESLVHFPLTMWKENLGVYCFSNSCLVDRKWQFERDDTGIFHIINLCPKPIWRCIPNERY